MDDIFLFSQRSELADMVDKWIRAATLADCTVNIITALHAFKCIDVKSTKEFLKNREKEEWLFENIREAKRGNQNS